jgi:exopolysaccharide production protein ExoZ
MKKIESLQILRAFAAIFVVLEHAWDHIVPLAPGPTWGSRLGFTAFGAFGVDLFFCLSGFLMATMLRPGPASPASAISFFLARVRRIYPNYCLWLGVLVAGTAFAFRGHTAGAGLSLPVLDAAALVHNVLLLPTLSVTGWHMMLPQAWTLTYEMYFYTLFALCIGLLDHRWRLIGLTISIAGLMLVTLTIAGPGDPFGLAITEVMANPVNLDFLAGSIYGFMYVARPSLHQTASDSRWLVVLCFAIFVVGFYTIHAANLRSFGLPAFAILIICTRMRFSDSNLKRVLVFLGDASYSIYLTHFLITSPGSHLLQKININPDVLGTLLTIASIIFGCAAYWILEKRINAWLKRRNPSRLPKVTQMPS